MATAEGQEAAPEEPAAAQLFPVSSYFTEEGSKRTFGPLKEIVLEFGSVQASALCRLWSKARCWCR